LADSRNTAEDLTELLGVAPEKIRTVYPGVGGQFRPLAEEGERAELSQRYGLQCAYVLCVGTIEPRKNLVAAIRAFSRVASGLNPGLELVLGGSVGWMAAETLEAAREAGERVRLIGRVPEGDLAKLYRQAEALLYPSHYEGFGLPPLEAMACGTPVVVARNSSLPEAVGEAGVYCDTDEGSIGDALERVLTDSALRQRLRRLGPERAGRFTWERAAAEVRSLYHGLA
jgi:glycosyltransferase involved in cell wall biosynthesis